ncbi:MAG: GDP-mannose 4,6-dehydratase [Candidatus Omnitrophota bacterium]|nr:GDP-mannose 4,6-dehydratase [Candidatus Omnitrophota bacterium]
MNNKFWKGKKVLITGFEGFLGSNLTKALASSGAKIFGLDIKVRRKKTVLTKADYGKIAVIKGSVVNYKLVERIINKNKINLVFHLAAEAIVGKCHFNPLKTFSANIEGTWNILEACRNSKNIQSIIIASSDKAYGAHKNLPYKEDAPLQGNHPYDVSKSCADLIAYTYAHTYNLPVAITRCGNIYGPGDFNFSRLIPDAMRSLVLNKKLKIRSDGKFVRDYVYIDDIVAGYIRIAELLTRRKLFGEAFNLSDEKPVTVIKLLKEIGKFYPGAKKLNYKIINTARYEIKKQYLSSAKARRILGWKPSYSLREGLRKTGKWYAEYFNQA